jgi:DNA-binding Xre family transcriptional regulator
MSPGQNKENAEIEIGVRMTLEDHLKRLEVAELSKLPHERRQVPNIPQLAKAIGVTRQALYNLSTNRLQSVKFDTLAGIISELRRRGFSVSISDLVVEYPAQSIAKAKSNEGKS